MEREKHKHGLIALIPVLCMLCMFTMFIMPVQAKGISTTISSKCKQTYQAFLRQGEFTYSSTHKEWAYDSASKTYQWATSQDSTANTYKITGFRVLNVDQKGQPELILRVIDQEGDGTPRVVVGYYKKGKVRFAKSGTDPRIITYTFMKINEVKNDPTAEKTLARYTKALKKTAKFYYSSKMKALYDATPISRLHPANEQYHYARKALYCLNGGKLVISKEATAAFSGMGSTIGGVRYTILTGNHEYRTAGYESAAYKEYVKNNFKGVKGYSFYALTAGNIAKKVK